MGTAITPRFPDGLTVFAAQGQGRDGDGVTRKEPTGAVGIIRPRGDSARALVPPIARKETHTTDHLPFLRRYLEAVGRMASATLAVADILAWAERGKQLWAGQEFEILDSVSQGDTVVREMTDRFAVFPGFRLPKKKGKDNFFWPLPKNFFFECIPLAR